MPLNELNLDRVFTYQPPTEAQKPKYKAVKDAVRANQMGSAWLTRFTIFIRQNFLYL